MRLQMFDRITEQPRDDFEIPDDVVTAALLVRDWIENNNIEELYGLSVRPTVQHRVVIK